jgi:hypothetical protein
MERARQDMRIRYVEPPDATAEPATVASLAAYRDL